MFDLLARFQIIKKRDIISEVFELLVEIAARVDSERVDCPFVEAELAMEQMLWHDICEKYSKDLSRWITVWNDNVEPTNQFYPIGVTSKTIVLLCSSKGPMIVKQLKTILPEIALSLSFASSPCRLHNKRNSEESDSEAKRVRRWKKCSKTPPL